MLRLLLAVSLLAAGAAQAVSTEPPVAASALVAQAPGWAAYAQGLAQQPIGTAQSAAGDARHGAQQTLDRACLVDCLPGVALPGADAGRAQALARDAGTAGLDAAAGAMQGSPVIVCWSAWWFAAPPAAAPCGWLG